MKTIESKFSLFPSSAEQSCPNLVSVMTEAARHTRPLPFPYKSNKQQSKCKSLQGRKTKEIHLAWATLFSGGSFFTNQKGHYLY